MKKIAHFATEFPPYITGGLGRHVEELIKIQCKTNKVDLFLPFEYRSKLCCNNLTINHVAVEQTDAPIKETYIEYLFRMGYAMASQACNSRQDYDVIHCHDYLTGVAGLLMKRILAKHLVITCHLPQFGLYESLLEKMVLCEADTVIGVSDNTRELLQKRYSLEDNQVITIKNGVDSEYFRPGSIPRDPFHLLFAGRIVPQKGLDVLIYTMKLLVEINPRFTLTVVGDGEWRHDAKNLAKYCGIPDHVKFLGWLSKSELLTSYQGAGIFVMPSQFEPFGLSALEAMACGLPIVAANEGGLKEFISEAVNGYLVAKSRPAEYAGRIYQIATNNDLMAKMSMASRNIACEYSWNLTEQLTADVYPNPSKRKESEGRSLINEYELLRSSFFSHFKS